MDLNGAVEFVTSGDFESDGDIRKIIDEFRTRSQEMGFYDQRMTFGNYQEDIQDELKAAYDETQRLEKDINQLVIISDVLADKIEEYEHRITDIGQEKGTIATITL